MAWLRSRAGPPLGLAAVVAWAAFLVAHQPVTSPWWWFADADGSYAGTALNLTYANSHARYLDHPGLPMHELLAASFEAERLGRRLAGDGVSESAFFAEKMLDLDSARPLYRGWAIVFYLAGAAVSFFAAARLLGHWGWGVAGGILWTAAPGLVAMSIQYRPDVPLGVLTVGVAYLIAMAAETRSPTRYLAAAAALGFAVTVKLHAAGLVVPLALAVLWRPPEGDWWQRARADLVAFAQRRWALVAAAALVWLLLVATFTRPRVPFSPTDAQWSILLAAVVLIAAYLGASIAVQRVEALRLVRPLFRPFYGAVAVAAFLGIALPASIVLDDGLQMLVVIARGLTGGGINKEIAPFSAPLDQFADFPLREAAVVFVLSGAAAVLGAFRREPLPVLLFTGAVVLAVMAQARLAATHYFAPAYLVSVPAALWLVRERARGLVGPVLAALLVAVVVLPQFRERRAAEITLSSFAAREAPALRLVEQRLQPGEVGLVPSYWPHPDSRYFEVVHIYVEHTPDRPYRFLPDTPRAAAFAAEHGLHPRYFVGPGATTVASTGPLALVTGTYRARRLPGVDDAVELVSGPRP
jgi:hypothetical protein